MPPHKKTQEQQNTKQELSSAYKRKLRKLKDAFPDIPEEILRETLIASEGNLGVATESLQKSFPYL